MSQPLGSLGLGKVKFHLDTYDKVTKADPNWNQADQKLKSVLGGDHKLWFSTISQLNLFGNEEQRKTLRDKFLSASDNNKLKTFLENTLHPEQLAILKTISEQFQQQFPRQNLSIANELAKSLFGDLADSKKSTTDCSNDMLVLDLMGQLNDIYGQTSVANSLIAYQQDTSPIFKRRELKAPEKDSETKMPILKEEDENRTSLTRTSSTSSHALSDDSLPVSPELGRRNITTKKDEDDSFKPTRHLRIDSLPASPELVRRSITTKKDEDDSFRPINK